MVGARLVLAVAVVAASCASDERYRGMYQGVVELDERLLGFEVGGRVTEIRVARGHDAPAGELLAVLDDTLAETARAGRIEEAKAARAHARLVRSGSRIEEIRRAEAQLAAAEATEVLARTNLARDQRLVSTGAIPKADYDESETRKQSAVAHTRSLREQLRELQHGSRPEEVVGAGAQAAAADVAAKLEAERVAQHQLRSIAPTTILEVHVEPGEVVSAGAPVLTVADVTRPYVDAFVPAHDLAGLDVGDRALVHVDALALPVPGVVEDIARRTEFTPRYVFSDRERATLVVRVRIRIDDRLRLLRAGVPAFVSIERGQP